MPDCTHGPVVSGESSLAASIDLFLSSALVQDLVNGQWVITNPTASRFSGYTSRKTASRNNLLFPTFNLLHCYPLLHHCCCCCHSGNNHLHRSYTAKIPHTNHHRIYWHRHYTPKNHCNTNDGSITITATGGSGSLEYSIMGGAAGTWQASNSFTGLAGGTYQIRVRNANGLCVVTYPDVILTAPVAPSITTRKKKATHHVTQKNLLFCHGNSNGRSRGRTGSQV